MLDTSDLKSAVKTADLHRRETPRRDWNRTSVRNHGIK